MSPLKCLSTKVYNENFVLLRFGHEWSVRASDWHSERKKEKEWLKTEVFSTDWAGETEKKTEVRRQWGHSDSEERRTQQGLVTGPTGPPLSTSWHSVVTRTHRHTRGWPTALPAALSVTVWLVVLSSPSPANHGAICYPTTWPTTRPAHTHSYTETHS